MGGPIRILGVDGEKAYRDRYRGWLGADHDVETVPDGQQALEALSEETDVVLLDRGVDGPDGQDGQHGPDGLDGEDGQRGPGRQDGENSENGREVAREIENRTHDCHVVMVGSDPADFDIVNYPIDRYVQKPLERADLDAIVEQYVTQREYRSALEEYFRLTSKLGAIEAHRSRSEGADDARYERLRNRVEEKRAEVDEAISASETDWDVAFKSCTNPATTEIGSEI